MLANCGVLRPPTVKNVRLGIQLADELFAKKGPTITKKISCSNICTIQCGTTKLFLDDRAVLLIRETNNCCTAVNLLMAYQSCQWFPQIANQKLTICAIWLHLLTFRLWGYLELQMFKRLLADSFTMLEVEEAIHHRGT